MIDRHFADLVWALARVRPFAGQLSDWGAQLAKVLAGGGRLLACADAGSAAQAQHLIAELVGRFETAREPLSAIALHTDTSAEHRDRQRLRTCSDRIWQRPCGAGLTAVLASRQHPNVVLVTATADDYPTGGTLAALFAADHPGIRVVGIPLCGRTAGKIGVRAGAQSVVRIDHGDGYAASDRLPVVVTEWSDFAGLDGGCISRCAPSGAVVLDTRNALNRTVVAKAKLVCRGNGTPDGY